MPKDENAYLYFRGLEMTLQKPLFELPHEGSDYANALTKIQPWEIHALREFVIRAMDAVSQAATVEYMDGKD